MAGNMLGIMITKYENLEHIAGIVRAARKAGHPVTIFMTDEGVKFTGNPRFRELLEIDGVEIAVCDYSCACIGLHEKAAGIIYGNQYNNAGMLHASERVLVF